jgi:hypothetical protein
MATSFIHLTEVTTTPGGQSVYVRRDRITRIEQHDNGTALVLNDGHEDLFVRETAREILDALDNPSVESMEDFEAA